MLTEKFQTLQLAVAGMLFVGFVQSIRGFLATIQFLSQRENITESTAFQQIVEFKAQLSMSESLSLYINIFGLVIIVVIFVMFIMSRTGRADR